MTALYLIPVLIFAIALIIVVGVLLYVLRVKAHRDVLKKIETQGAQRKEERTDLPLKERVQSVFLKVIKTLGPLAKPKEEQEISRLRQRLMQGGLSRFKNIVMIFYGSKAFGMFLLPVLFVLLKVTFSVNMVFIKSAVVLVLLAVVGFYLPDVWLRFKINNRKDQISRGFPDALDLMVICAEAGMGLDAIINRVAEDIKLRHAALSEELKIVMLELRAGKLRRDALKNLAMRTDLEDVQSFATILIQTEKFGTNMAQAMRVLSDSMRTKRMQRIEELAASLAVKLLFPTVLLIFPSMFLVLVGPALVQAFRVWQS